MCSYLALLVCDLCLSGQEEEAQPPPEASVPLSEGKSSLTLVPLTQCHLLAKKIHRICKTDSPVTVYSVNHITNTKRFKPN